MSARKVPLMDRIIDKIELSPDGCWLWTAALSKGYGQMKVDGKFRGSHRVVYELLVEPIPATLQLDHLCRVPRCVNPDHLEPVTQLENMRRGWWGTKEACPQGHPYSAENTRIQLRADGSHRKRVCIACNRDRWRN